MESRVKFTNSNYGKETAIIRYEKDELIFFTKPYWSRLIFGLVGEALASWKFRFVINISNIEKLKISETRGGKPVYELVMNDGDRCKIFFECYDGMTTSLKRDLSNKIVSDNE